jgi:hypothetical protein
LSNEIQNTFDLVKKLEEKLHTKGFSPSKQELLKIHTIVRSRVFGLGKSLISGMVPISDLFNYDPEKINTNWHYDYKSESFKIQVTKPIPKNHEVKFYLIALKFRFMLIMGILIILIYFAIMDSL